MISDLKMVFFACNTKISTLCFLKDSGVKEDELQAILNYLLTMHEVILEFLIWEFYFFKLH